MNKKHQTSGTFERLTIISVAISVALLSSLVRPIFASGAQDSRERNREAAEEVATSQTRTTENDVITTDGSGVFASENSQRRIEFSRNGIRCLPKLRQSEDAEFDYHPTSLIAQRDDQFSEQTLRAVRPKRNGNEIYYFRSDGLLEKYRSTEDGLEQTFVLQQSPAAADQDLLIRGQVSSGLQAQASSLRTLSGVTYSMGRRPVVHYESPVVTDAAGREATFELRLEGDQLDLLIEAAWLREAVYPVTVRSSIRNAGDRAERTEREMSVVSVNEALPVWRLQLRVQTADVANAGTDDDVSAKLNSANLTWMDYGRNDFERNGAFTYDLVQADSDGYVCVTNLSDITMLRISKNGSDGLCLRALTLYVNGVAIYSLDYGAAGRWLDNDGTDHRTITVSSAALRAHPSWVNFPLTVPPRYIYRPELESRIEAIVGNKIKGSSEYWGQLHGRAVEVTMKDDRTIHVDLDLAYDIIGPDPEIDVDFDVVFSCSNGNVIITIQHQTVSVESAWYVDVLIWTQAAEWCISRLIEHSMHSMVFALNTPWCPQLRVFSDATLMMEF